MTNEQKAQRLDEMATALHGQANYSSLCASLNTEGSSRRAMHEANQREQESDAALLREAAAVMRERGVSEVQWDAEGGAAKNGLYLWAGPVCNGFGSLVLKGKKELYLDWHPTLEAAQAAAVAWVDEQEGEG